LIAFVPYCALSEVLTVFGLVVGLLVHSAVGPR
jgi:F0F1-type ATP synthase membrane subunit c/vacuolar-type H+-ATPase subunit K